MEDLFTPANFFFPAVRGMVQEALAIIWRRVVAGEPLGREGASALQALSVVTQCAEFSLGSAIADAFDKPPKWMAAATEM